MAFCGGVDYQAVTQGRQNAGLLAVHGLRGSGENVRRLLGYVGLIAYICIHAGGCLPPLACQYSL